MAPYRTRFEYPYDVNQVMLPWRDKLGAREYDEVVTRLMERDRALEDYISISPEFDGVYVNEGTTSTTATDLATVGPTVTVRLPRGICSVHYGALAHSTVDNQTAGIELWMDGSLLHPGPYLSNNTGGGIAASISTLVYVDNGSLAGEHTFQMKYLQTLAGPNTANFDLRFLLVTPLP